MRLNYTNILLIVSLLLFGSCTENPELKKSEVFTTFSITSHSTKTGEASDKELINSWWIAFVDESGVVKKTLDRPIANTAAVDRESFKLSLPQGKYTAFAFANISKEELKTALGLESTITEGSTMPNLSTATWTKVGNIGDYIPMTGKLDIEITNSSNGFEIEVVRLWAKLCFQFTTDVEGPITVSKISMTSALTSKVNLLPNYSSIGSNGIQGSAPVLPVGTVCGTLEKPFSPEVTINKGIATETTFYLLESTAANHPTKHYPLTFELKYNNGTTHKVEALAYGLSYINRNDFITIPVLITDWLVDVSVLFYPPIGGYPAVLSEKNDGEFYAKFGSGGRFVVNPTISSSDGSVVTNSNLDITLTTEDESGILNKQPTYDKKTSEIVGEIADGKYGTAVVTLEIKITDGDLQYSIIRKFYIIRENN